MFVASRNWCSRTSTIWPGRSFERDDLARRLARHRDVARTLRGRDEDLQAREEALPGVLQTHEAEPHLRLLPQQDVVLEVDRRARPELDVDDRDELALDAHRRVADDDRLLGVVALSATGSVYVPTPIGCGRRRAAGRAEAGAGRDRSSDSSGRSCARAFAAAERSLSVRVRRGTWNVKRWKIRAGADRSGTADACRRAGRRRRGVRLGRGHRRPSRARTPRVDDV